MVRQVLISCLISLWSNKLDRSSPKLKTPHLNKEPIVKKRRVRCMRLVTKKVNCTMSIMDIVLVTFLQKTYPMCISC